MSPLHVRSLSLVVAPPQAPTPRVSATRQNHLRAKRRWARSGRMSYESPRPGNHSGNPMPQRADPLHLTAGSH